MSFYLPRAAESVLWIHHESFLFTNTHLSLSASMFWCETAAYSNLLFNRQQSIVSNGCSYKA